MVRLFILVALVLGTSSLADGWPEWQVSLERGDGSGEELALKRGDGSGEELALKRGDGSDFAPRRGDELALKRGDGEGITLV